MDDVENAPDDQLWAMLDHTEGAERAEILEELAGRAHNRGAYDDAISLSEAAARVYREVSLDRSAAFSLYNQAQSLMQLRRTDDAVALFDEAAELFRIVGEETEIGHCVSRSAWAYAQAGRDEEATERWATAERLFAANDDAEGAGRAAMNRGEALGRIGHQTDALTAFGEARAHFRGSVPAPLVAWADDRAAASLIELGRVGEALELLRACLHVAEVIGEAREHAYAAFRLGWTLVIKGNNSEALVHLQAARGLYSDVQDLGGCARCDHQAAIALARDGEFEQAESLYIQARSVFDALGDDSAASQCDVNRAVLYSEVGRFDDAITLNQRVLATLDHDDEWTHHAVVSRLANDLVAADRAQEALDLLDEHDSVVRRDEIHERATRLSARARTLIAVGRGTDALPVADAGLALVAGSDYTHLRAEFYEARGLAREAAGDPEFQRDLAYAVALFLAVDSTGRARDLSQRFLPDDDVRSERGPSPHAQDLASMGTSG